MLTLAAVHGDRGVRRAGLRASVACAVLASLLVHATTLAAQATSPAEKQPAVTLESVAGSKVKRVTLTAKAAERLDIQVGRVSEDVVVHRQVVSGLVVAPVAARSEPRLARGSARTDLARTLWVRVTLSPGEWERLDKETPARIAPLATRDRGAKDVWARPSGRRPVEDERSPMLTVYYVMPPSENGIEVNDRVRVELQQIGGARRQKLVPYDAIFYDAHGDAWVYTNTLPLTFERQRVVIDRVVDGMAQLTEGPVVGTPVVTVGAPLLYGAEIFGK